MKNDKCIDLSGKWIVSLGDEDLMEAVLPGTLDGNQIGFPDTGGKELHPDSDLGEAGELKNSKIILTRLTRNYTYEGRAFFSRKLTIPKEYKEKRVFIDVERSRELTLSVNGKEIEPYIMGTISTPYVFEITSAIIPGENNITFCCDNSYPSWPHDSILYSSAATDETQTNWNGLIGCLCLRYEKKNFISFVCIYPSLETAYAVVEIDCATEYKGKIWLESEAFTDSVYKKVDLSIGKHTLIFNNILFSKDAKRWEEGEGNLYSLFVKGNEIEEYQERFGIRVFNDKDGRLSLNGRHIFLRSETNCCVFPETGHMPMTVDKWKEVLSIYKSYGVNCMRFHSHFPPSAAFAAADEMGMLMQAELSHWNPRTAFEDELSWNYYQLELKSILHAYANHPSFVMLSWGNELHCGVLGYKRMILLLKHAKETDSTRLYAEASNAFYGNMGTCPDSDFYTSSNIYDKHMRGAFANMQGYINEKYPCSKMNFNDAMKRIRKEYTKPVFSFEVGQFEILPDFAEWDDHTGVTRPDNYMHIRDKAKDAGLMNKWGKYVEATGELSLLSYKEEVEAAMRTEGMSGISLLGLQDFPGQGTALIGMLNAHLRPKPYGFAKPERFNRFFTDFLPLILMDKYTYKNTEKLLIEIKIVNYTKHDIEASCIVMISDENCIYSEQCIGTNTYQSGELSEAGRVYFTLESFDIPKRLTVTAKINEAENSYPIWVYPDTAIMYPKNVTVTETFLDTIAAINEGKRVLYAPPATNEYFPQSIKTQFTTDFWSVGTFDKQEGFMGFLIDQEHPVFASFPTEFHTNWQWWQMSQGRAVIYPEGITSLVTAIDCYAYMRNMGVLTEFSIGDGKLMICSMGLTEYIKYPEVRALTQSILNYMSSDEFNPVQKIDRETLHNILTKK